VKTKSLKEISSESSKEKEKLERERERYEERLGCRKERE